MPEPTIPAATVVVVRDGLAGLELLMVKRHERSRDLPGLSVFPGGLVEPADAEPSLASAATGYSHERASAALGEALERAAARSLYVAACRELFEEAGLLLARHDDGGRLGTELLARAAEIRLAVQSGSETLADFLGRERAHLALDALVPLARWITPEFQMRRWDARFFLTRAPDEQRALHDGTEIAETLWIRPADALADYRAGGTTLAPPTFCVLEGMAPFESAGTALEATRAAGPPRPILPVPLAGAPDLTMLYPGDHQYPGERGDGRNRLILDGGRWRSERQ